jgi:starvation-inducible outer membrane lipoprotein
MWGRWLIIVAVLILTGGCGAYQVVPTHLKGKVNPDILIEQVETTPAAYQGQTVAWGGEVLEVSKNDKEARIQVLHLPLDRTLRPMEGRAGSRGRFVAIDRAGDIKDPSLLKPGTLVTVLGDVAQPSTIHIGQDTVQAPTLRIRDMTAWELEVGMGHIPFRSPFIGSRPYVFWDGERVASENK